MNGSLKISVPILDSKDKKLHTNDTIEQKGLIDYIK